MPATRLPPRRAHARFNLEDPLTASSNFVGGSGVAQPPSEVIDISETQVPTPFPMPIPPRTVKTVVAVQTDSPKASPSRRTQAVQTDSIRHGTQRRVHRPYPLYVRPSASHSMHIPHPYRPYHLITCALCTVHASQSVHPIPCVPCTCHLTHKIPCTSHPTHTDPIDLDKPAELPFPGPIDLNQIIIYGRSLAQIVQDTQEESARETMERVADKMEEILPDSEIGKIVTT
jgi:hypothetical protein